MNYFQRLWGHFKTVTIHRHYVRKNCFACGIYAQGLKHDLSKFSFAEFHESVQHYQGNRSPYMEEKELYGYAPGWLHHKGRNKHHWEYWYDMINGIWQPLDMPFLYVVEMVCDRVAACRAYQKEKYVPSSALDYYNSRNDKLYMHDHTRKELERMLTLIAEKGEQQAFTEIKQEVIKYKKSHPNGSF